jgi:hypothetical protein
MKKPLAPHAAAHQTCALSSVDQAGRRREQGMGGVEQPVYKSWSGLIAPSIGVVIGLVLLFRAKGLLRLIRLARPMSA